MSREYSLWLIPDRDSRPYQQFDELNTEYAGRYQNAPDFEPHVTLLGGLNVKRSTLKERTAKLGNQDSLELTFLDVSCSTTPHQCVFLLVDPTVELMELHERTVEIFELGDRMYVPHLSLIYSDMDIENRVRAVQSIRSESLPSSVRIDTIEIVDTTDTVSEWETVATHSLD